MWMNRLNEDCVFISAQEKRNIEELRGLLYRKVKEIHVQRFPYNDFLYQEYGEGGGE
jgi:GTP-binding protein HflX